MPTEHRRWACNRVTALPLNTREDTEVGTGAAHDVVEMCHRLFERGVVERPALDRRERRQRRWRNLGLILLDLGAK